jgi:maltokinase
VAISSDLERLLSAWLPRQAWFPKLETELGADPDITPMSVTRLFEFDTRRHPTGDTGSRGPARSARGDAEASASPQAAETTTPQYRLVDNRGGPRSAAARGASAGSGSSDSAAGGEAVSAGIRDIGVIQGNQAIISVGDGRTLRRLNIPLSFRTHEDFALRPHLIGVVDDITLGQCYVYDGCADPVFVLAYAQAMASGRRFDGGQVQANRVGESEHAFADLSTPEALLAHSDVIRLGIIDSRTNESSVVIDDPEHPCVLTFFRVVRPGVSSAVRIPVALTEVGSAAVPEVIGWAAGRWFDANDLETLSAPLVMLSRTERDSRPAWREAVDVACAVDSGSIGSYNKKAMALGARIGELHLDLAAEFGVVRSIGEPTAYWVKKWQDRVDFALARAPLALSNLASRLRAHRDSLAALEALGGLQRIHGELTLDHVTTSESGGFRVVNFSEDTQEFPKPPAIDLVALLRSMDYAAGYARLRRTGALEVDAQPVVLGFSGLGESSEFMQEVVDSPEYLWSSQAQNSLLTGYSHAVNASVGLHDPVVRAVLIDRLLVEVVTELRNRPTWLIVPLATLTLLLGGRLKHDIPVEDEAAAKRAWSAPSATVSAEEFSQATAEKDQVLLLDDDPIDEDESPKNTPETPAEPKDAAAWPPADQASDSTGNVVSEPAEEAADGDSSAADDAEESGFEGLEDDPADPDDGEIDDDGIDGSGADDGSDGERGVGGRSAVAPPVPARPPFSAPPTPSSKSATPPRPAAPERTPGAQTAPPTPKSATDRENVPARPAVPPRFSDRQ